jgi:multiple sugar transport system substrate-binding protein
LSSIKELYKKYFFLINAIPVVTIILIFYLSISVSTMNEKGNEVQIYFADNISKAHSKVIENFNAKYKGRIKVNPIDLPFVKFSTNERKELLTRSLRSKSDRIDVFAVDLIWVKRFAKWSLPLDKYFNTAHLSDYLSFALQPCYSENHLYAIPLYLDISTMYYREDLLQQLPNYKSLQEKLDSSITWEEFISLGKSISSQKRKFYTFPADAYEGLICSFTELLLSQSPEIFSNFDEKKSSDYIKHGIRLLVDLVNKFELTPKEVVNYKERESYSFFLQNDGMFVRGWPSFLKDYKNINHDKSKEKYIKQTQLPHLQNFDKRFVFGGWNLMISKYTPHINEVLEFIKYTSSEEAQRIMFEEGAYLPVNKNLYSDTTLVLGNQKLNSFLKLFKYGVHRPSWKNYTKISDYFSQIINKAISQEISVDEALSRIKSVLKTVETN